MQNKISQVIALVDDSADPAILANSNSKILWYNKSAKRILAISDNIPIRNNDIKIIDQGDQNDDLELGDLFNSDAVRAILSCQSWCEVPLGKLNINHHPLELIALALSFVGPDPDDEYFLVVMRSSLANNPNNSQVDQELSAIAHDLKNPLGAIFGYSDALIDTNVGASLNPKQREIISRIRSTAARSLDLVRNIQQLSLLKGGSKSQVSASCELNNVLKTVLDETWRDNSEFPKVKLELTGEKLNVKIERLLLERILTNLYTNALKFTPTDGVIILRTKIDHDNNSVIFEINNNSPIIPANELAHIFDRHMRGTTSRGTSGSGLGLYIVHQIVQRAAGTINVTSNANTGTTFRITLPSG